MPRTSEESEKYTSVFCERRPLGTGAHSGIDFSGSHTAALYWHRHCRGALPSGPRRREPQMVIWPPEWYCSRCRHVERGGRPRLPGFPGGITIIPTQSSMPMRAGGIPASGRLALESLGDCWNSRALKPLP
jgi:hypothetical protein